MASAAEANWFRKDANAQNRNAETSLHPVFDVCFFKIKLQEVQLKHLVDNSRILYVIVDFVQFCM